MRKASYLAGIGLFAILPLAAFSLFAQQPTATAIAAKLDARYNHLNSYRADFTEHFTGLNLDRTESGTLTMKKPGRMRWDYSSPTGKIFVIDGQNAWFYSPGDAQAQHVPTKKLDDLRSPMRYLLGHAHLEKELVGLVLSTSHNGFTLSGTPKDMEQSVRLVSLQVNTTGELADIRVEETDGTTTDFHFNNIQEDIPLKNSDFLFTPPPGLPVVDALPPI